MLPEQQERTKRDRDYSGVRHGRLVQHGHEDRERCVVHGPLKKGPEATGVREGVNTATVLHLNRNSVLSDCQNKVNLGFAAALGEVCHIETWYTRKELSNRTLNDSPGEVREGRALE